MKRTIKSETAAGMTCCRELIAERGIHYARKFYLDKMAYRPRSDAPLVVAYWDGYRQVLEMEGVL